jgi:CDP-glucose 4,6-dehydratase
MTNPSPFWQKRPVFVTGASGFLGRWLVRRLVDSGADIVCLVRQESKRSHPFLGTPVRVIAGDVTDRACLTHALVEFRVDTVFHLAAQALVSTAQKSPLETLVANVTGTCAVLDACRLAPAVKSLVLASSRSAYGTTMPPPFDESTPLEGRHPYDVSKSCVDLIAQAYAATYGLQVAITRCANLYGAGDLNFDRIVPGTLRYIYRGELPIIRSNGRCVRDYLYVEDAVDAYLLLAEQLYEHPEWAGAAFNLSGGAGISAIDLVSRILQITGSRLRPRVSENTDEESGESYLSCEKARRVLGWVPRHSMDAGLALATAWYQEFFKSDSPSGQL